MKTFNTATDMNPVEIHATMTVYVSDPTSKWNNRYGTVRFFSAADNLVTVNLEGESTDDVKTFHPAQLKAVLYFPVVFGSNTAEGRA